MYRLDLDEASKYASEDPIIYLRNAIIKKAAEDYMQCKKGGHAEARLERFFRGKWCNELMCDMELTGAGLLRMLKKAKRR